MTHLEIIALTVTVLLTCFSEICGPTQNCPTVPSVPDCGHNTILFL